MELANVQRLESQNQITRRENGTSFIRTCFNGLNAISGIAVICFYTGLLIKKCMDSNPNIKTYPDIGDEAFGYKGRALISIFMYLELYLLVVGFLILEGDNLHKLFPHTKVSILGMSTGGKQVFIVLTALVMLPMAWLRNLSILAYVSAGGILASLILVATVFWVGAFENVGFNEKGDLWRFNGIPTAAHFVTVAMQFSLLCTSMKDKTQFPKVLLMCFVLSSIRYESMAVIGYLMFGENLRSQVTLNLPLHNITSKIAIYTTLINPITKYALYISPIATTLEEKIISKNKNVNNNCTLMISLLIRTILVVSSVVIALIVPFFGYVMSFIGAFSGASVSILFPCLCYLKINKRAREFGAELVFILIIIIFGGLIAVTGTIVSVRDIVEQVSKK